MTRRAAAFAPSVAALALVMAGAGGETFDFMPKGGRALLLERVTGTRLAEVQQQRRTEAEWLAWAREQSGRKAMTEKEQATLAAYMAVNMPSGAASVAALPPDGRDLSWEQCQSCHSLFTGYLTQQGSATRWRNTFLSPFHRNIRMTPQEREEFARYSEINMPMKVEDVPGELRF